METFLSAYEVKNNYCLFLRLFKIKTNGVSFLEGRTGGGPLARFMDEENNESLITDIEISFSRITKISTLLSCFYATNSV